MDIIDEYCNTLKLILGITNDYELFKLIGIDIIKYFGNNFWIEPRDISKKLNELILKIKSNKKLNNKLIQEYEKNNQDEENLLQTCKNLFNSIENLSKNMNDNIANINAISYENINVKSDGNIFNTKLAL